MATKDTPSRFTGVRTTGLGGRFFLTRDTATYVLGDVEVFIWRLCDGRTPIAEIADRLSRTYEVGQAQALTDVTEFVEELTQARLLEEV